MQDLISVSIDALINEFVIWRGSPHLRNEDILPQTKITASIDALALKQRGQQINLDAIYEHLYSSVMKYKFELPFTGFSKKNSRPIFKMMRKGDKRGKPTGRSFIGKSKELRAHEEKSIEILTEQVQQYKLEKPIDWNIKAHFIFDFEGECKMDFDNMLNGFCDALQSAGAIKNDKLIKIGTWEINEHIGRDRCLVILEPRFDTSTYVKLSSNKPVSFSELLKAAK